MRIKTKMPIVPIMIYQKPKFFKPAHILVGEPIEFTEYYDRKLTDTEYVEADDKLRSIMLKMRDDHTQFLLDKKNKKTKA